MIVTDRLKSVISIYDNIGDFFSLFKRRQSVISILLRNRIKHAILHDTELKMIIDDLRSHQTPRFLLIGNTGHGKSSLINAMLGYYSAIVSDVKIGTRANNTQYEICDVDGKLIYTILDSRGINESTVDNNRDAEATLLEDISKLLPDAIIHVHKATARDGLNFEIDFLKLIISDYEKKNGIRLPLLIVLTNCDELPPRTRMIPSDYDDLKIKNIEKAKDYYSTLIKQNNLECDGIIVTSSLMEFEKSNEQLALVPLQERMKIKPLIDGRYNIDVLKKFLSENICANDSLRSNAYEKMYLQSITERCQYIFSNLLADYAHSSLFDLYVFVELESIFVKLIAYLTGKDISYKEARAFVTKEYGESNRFWTIKNIRYKQIKNKLNIFSDKTEIDLTMKFFETLVKSVNQHYIGD